MSLAMSMPRRDALPASLPYLHHIVSLTCCKIRFPRSAYQACCAAMFFLCVKHSHSLLIKNVTEWLALSASCSQSSCKLQTASTSEEG